MIEPYYQKDGITIYNADCREVLPQLGVFDVVVTDTPYGVSGGKGGDSKKYGKANYSGNWIDNEDYILEVVIPVITECIKKSKRAAATVGNRHLFLYPKPDDIGCFWTPASVTHGPWGFTCFSPILYYGKDHRAGKGALPTGKLVTERAEKSIHPCPKPLTPWRWLIDKMSQPKETILDPFMGSGTTLVAAKMEGRKAVGIEINEKYCEAAVNRLAQGVLF